MKSIQSVHLRDVQRVYSGPEGRLWELVMGQQVHIGGLASSQELAQRADIPAGSRGVDLCCCTGAGMRFLVRLRGAAHMTGVDATGEMIDLGRQRCRAEGLSDRIDFVQAEVTRTGLADGCADFVWGEDAWCYVEDKPALIAEAARLVRPGGTIAFTDWLEGDRLADDQAERFLAFMKFPSLLTLDDYGRLLESAGCRVVAAEDTGRFAPAVQLYIDMLTLQLTYDALNILNFDSAMLGMLAEEMKFANSLAQDGRIIQGLLVARKAE